MDTEDIRKKLLGEISRLPEEQSAKLKQTVESMSDEQLIQFINSQNCLFCGIVSGNVETFKIYESDSIMVILDINPATSGHILVMPKKHFQFLSQIPNELVYELFSFLKVISSILLKVTNAEGITIHILQGTGQNVPHFVINVVPRYKDDNLDFMPERKKAGKEELEKIASSVRSELSNHIQTQLNKEKQKKTEEPKEEQYSEKKEAENKSSTRMRIP